MPDERLELNTTPMGTQQLKAVAKAIALENARQELLTSLYSLRLELPEEVWQHHVNLLEAYLLASV